MLGLNISADILRQYEGVAMLVGARVESGVSVWRMRRNNPNSPAPGLTCNKAATMIPRLSCSGNLHPKLIISTASLADPVLFDFLRPSPSTSNSTVNTCFPFSIMAKSEGDLENQHPSTQQVESAQEIQLGTTEKYGGTRNLIEADLLDDRYAQTQRGLNNRQVQMM